MSRAVLSDSLGGGECVVVVLGHAFRCIMVNADVRLEPGALLDVTSSGDDTTRYARGPGRRRMTCEYVVLDEVDVPVETSRAIMRQAEEAIVEARRAIALGGLAGEPEEGD